jgi:hypothetical protein
MKARASGHEQYGVMSMSEYENIAIVVGILVFAVFVANWILDRLLGT